MAVNNRDKGLPQTPAVGVLFDAVDGGGENRIPVLTNNFTPSDPINPIFWGPNQPWVDANTYRSPRNWRYKELLSIPRVVRMVIAKSNPCDHTGANEGDLICTRITLGDGFWILTVSHLIFEGVDTGPTIIVFALNSTLFQVGAVNMIFSGTFPSPDFAPCPATGHLNVYGFDGDGNPKATVTVGGSEFGDEV